MSKAAVKAVINAALADDSQVIRDLLLQDERTFNQVVEKILSLSEDDKKQVKQILSNPDTAAAQMAGVDDRMTPGPGVIGTGR